MTLKQKTGLQSVDGSYYVTLTDGAGNLAPASGGSSGNPNGQATMANSAPVVISSDQSAVPVTLTSTTITGTVAATQSGTWTVQPGNTANTTAWKVDGSAVTQPISGSVTVTQATAANLNATVVGTGTFATQLTGATNNINNVSGTVSLPTGAATSAAQTTMATNQTVIQAPITPATATATKSELIGAQYNATPVVFTNGQQGSIACGPSGELLISGTIASGATDSGNPVKVGGKYNSSVSTLTNGQRADLQLDSFGNVRSLMTGNPNSGSDGISNNSLNFTPSVNSQAAAILLFPQASYNFNGSTWDRFRGDTTGSWISNEARTSNKTAASNGSSVRPIATTVGAVVNKPFQVPELDWSYPAAAGGISNTTTAVTMVAAAGIGIRNYLTAIQVSAGTLGAASEIAVRDGAGGTVIWRGFISTAGGNQSVVLSSPIKSTANTLLEVVTLTATVTGAVYINAQGYQAP